MISDLISALEFVINQARGLVSPERKRQQLGKQLLTIYHHIQAVADRGAEIVGLVERDFDSPRVVAVQILLDQQSALRTLTAELNNEPAKSLLPLHIPTFRHFPILAASKFERLGVFLHSLFDGRAEIAKLKTDVREALDSPLAISELNLESRRKKPPTEAERMLLQPEVKRFTQTFAGGSVHGHDPSTLPDEAALVLMENSADERLLTHGRPADLDDYSSAEAFLVQRQTPQNAPVRVFSTSEQLEQARRTVDSLKTVSENLRKVLLDHFKMEELM